MSWFLVAYDIAENKPRNKALRACRAICDAYQYSVFEAELDHDQTQCIIEQLLPQLDTQDSLILVTITNEVEQLGTGLTHNNTWVVI